MCCPGSRPAPGNDGGLRWHIVTPTTTDPNAAASAAAAALAEETNAAHHDLAVVLGSGWETAAEELGTPTATLAMSTLPGFETPSVAGHSGEIRSVRVADKQVLVLLGRTHLYEGLGVEPVVHGVRTAVATGCTTVLLTNAAGGIRDGIRVGQPVMLSDHLNLTARSPLVGARFVDLTNLYSPRLRDIARSIDPTLEEGVYAGVPGPHLETPAEIRMLRAMGADLVGMSTVLEAIAARTAGAEVFGLSLVTNLAAGLSGQPLQHGEVLAAGRNAAGSMGKLLRWLIERA
jgi:purine-nucleoside phosphorylase